ncbi:MAG: protein kinase [Myxococcaceae bacterium]|nr:protein kinase [Myxococcaceae bacterium]
MSVPSPIRRVGRYQVQRLLAEGGMGRVLLAKTEGPAGFTKLVVLKTLQPHLAVDPGVLETFLVEARVSAALFHPNVAQVFELVEDGGEYFLAMEYVRGRSVRELLASRPRLPVPVALSITSQVLRALQHAHEARDDQGRRLNVLHRDVSPENVLVSWEGAVKLLDFGLAGAKRRAGKAGYVAPELLEGAAPSVASDLYAAAVLLAECLVGPPPFPALEAPWGPLVERALDADPRRRFSSAADFADALDALARDAGDHVTQATLAHTLREVFGAPSDESLTAAPARRTALLTREHSAAPPAEVRRSRAGFIVAAGLVLVVGAILAAIGPAKALGSLHEHDARDVQQTPGRAERDGTADVRELADRHGTSEVGKSPGESVLRDGLSNAPKTPGARPERAPTFDALKTSGEGSERDGTDARNTSGALAEHDEPADVRKPSGAGAERDRTAARKTSGALAERDATSDAPKTPDRRAERDGASDVGKTRVVTSNDRDASRKTSGALAGGDASDARKTPDEGSGRDAASAARKQPDDRDASRKTSGALAGGDGADARKTAGEGAERVGASDVRKNPGPVDDHDATLDVRVIPWAQVTVDGRAVGVTPMPPLRLSRGRHVVELRNPALGVAASRTVTLEKGAAQRLQVDLLDELDAK